jgi:hypothetical protein
MDAGIYPEFYIEAQLDKARTEAEGCSKYRDVERVRVHVAGDQRSVPSMKVTDLHRKRWPVQYDAFKAGIDAPLNGTPLIEWPLLTTSRIKELLDHDIRTVEDIVELRDSARSALGMDGRKLQAQASAWLESAKDGAHATKLAAELLQRDDMIELLREQIAELSDSVDEVKKARGRPKKAA